MSTPDWAPTYEGRYEKGTAIDHSPAKQGGSLDLAPNEPMLRLAIEGRPLNVQKSKLGFVSLHKQPSSKPQSPLVE